MPTGKPDPDADGVRALWRRVDACQANVVDQAELLRSLNDRLLGELIMCDPTFVLTLEQREAALRPQSDRAAPAAAGNNNHDFDDSSNHGDR